MVFFQNLMIFYLLTYAVHNYDNLQVYPVYIHFVNHPLNQIPSFLKTRKDIGIVIQKQFESLQLDRRYLSVGLYFDGILHFIKIDLTTIYSVEIENICRIKFDNRLKIQNMYIKEIQHINELEYLNQINNIEQIIVKYGGESTYNTSQITPNKEIVTKIIDLSDVIKNNNEGV